MGKIINKSTAKKEQKKTVRVKLKDVLNNPFRDFSISKIEENKIAALKESIKDSGFWEGLVGRQRDSGKVEVCFGHHRIETLRRLFEEDHEIEIQVQVLDDAKMIKLMHQENNQAFDTSLMQIDNAVFAARKYLTDNPKIARALLSEGSPSFKRVRIGAPLIAKFLETPVDTIKNALERIHWFEEGGGNKEALYKMPNTAAADYFMTCAKGMKYDEQLIRANIIVQKECFGERTIAEVMGMELPKNKKGHRVEDAGYCGEHLQEGIKFMNQAARELDRVLDGFGNTLMFGPDISADDIPRKAQEKFRSSINALAKKCVEVSKKLDSKSIEKKERVDET